MPMQNETRDVCVIGSGPAGLQAGYFFKKKGIDFIILERGSEVCSFFRAFPRHRQFISINKVHTGLSNAETRLRHDWNSLLNDEGLLFKDWSRKYFPAADDFVAYAETFAAQLQDRIFCDSNVVEISKTDGVFDLRCANGMVHRARHVIVATGVSQPWDPGIEGFDLVDNYFDFDPDPEQFENERVLILGKGNSAFETADALVEYAASIHVMSPNPVRFAWQTHFVGHLRAVNNNFLDTYQLKSQNAVIDATATKIERKDGAYTVTAKMSAATGHEIVLTYDRVIACTGFRFDADIFAENIRPALCHFGKFPAMTAEWESESVEGLFFAGTIMQSRDYRKTMSGFVHGFRHNVKCLAEFVAGRVQGTPYPNTQTPLDAETLTTAIIERISTCSGMFLQPGFLCDVIEVAGPQPGRSFHDVPVAWVQETDTVGRDHLRITLEYGDFGGDSMHVKRQHNVFGDTPDAFIHPVIRHIRDGVQVGEVHLADHLDADWRPREDRGDDIATVLRMTFQDAGETLAPSEVARRQISAFLAAQGIGQTPAAAQTAAE
ncbi:NAD(P)-binding domain-containing protein [Roseobacter sinensis]|uniref:NAD(P)-binding domain-containing protein n=1 Tax=Roseobacter sinensis TaxID=2931391 RepID=A0ABT3BAA6_9RHOB|nr:NAD(P)-binding domain-containing protein [Roseobacter sp. WL0113]MCV3270475.1 NAD(P)-binding domain-containing protein [Roseobacter sp. WL0113]